MDQIHIGYNSWNAPEVAVMPKVQRLESQIQSPELSLPKAIKLSLRQAALKNPTFEEKDGYVSMEAEHYTRCTNGKEAKWTVIPELGRTLSGLTTLPVTASVDGMALEYDMEITSNDFARVIVRFAPTLNFNVKGLRYAISFDGKAEKIININGDYNGDLGQIQKEQVIDSENIFKLKKGKHTLRIRPLDNGLVFEKIMIDLGGMRNSYLGAPETIAKK